MTTRLQTPDPRHQTPAKPRPHEIIWTLHAARRVLQRGFDIELVLEGLHQFIASGQLKPEPRPYFWKDMKLVACQGKDPNQLIVVTVANKRKHGNHRRRNHRGERGRP